MISIKHDKISVSLMLLKINRTAKSTVFMKCAKDGWAFWEDMLLCGRLHNRSHIPPSSWIHCHFYLIPLWCISVIAESVNAFKPIAHDNLSGTIKGTVPPITSLKACLKPIILNLNSTLKQHAVIFSKGVMWNVDC